MGFERTDRIAEEYKREVSSIIRDEIRDPRVAEFTSITSVSITRDLRYAKIYVSVLGDEKQQGDTITGLKSAAG
ncbi:MAG TPA: 30S ribosome-binding factor RbfA, partial [Clostridiaceae bacterium]|nr:30S ribosome-binding factor RbfA [Clostridiaceae bacterium]